MEPTFCLRSCLLLDLDFLLHNLPPIIHRAPVISGRTPVRGRRRSLLRRGGLTGSLRHLQTLRAKRQPGLRQSAAARPGAREQMQGPLVRRSLQGAVHLHQVSRRGSARTAAGRLRQNVRRPVWITPDFVGQKRRLMRVRHSVHQPDQGVPNPGGHLSLNQGLSHVGST